jgi:hypothetical protein
LAASGHADDPESDEQVTKDHNEDDGTDDITVDPSADVTVEATEDVTTEAASGTPPPSFRSGGFDADADAGTPAPMPRAPTLLGVPIQSLPLPGVTASSLQDGDETRTIDYNDEITVLKPPAPADPLAALDALDDLDRPSITDDDEEETKVEPAEAAMKAAASIDDVTTALSAQASLEREKALRRSASPASSLRDDLEFADPDGEDDEQGEQEESLDDELSDEDEVISAGGAIEEEEDVQDDEDEDDGAGDGVATATFMKPADSTGLSGLLNPRRPPTGGREGFGSRLPTPYSQAATAPAPSTSPFASRLGPAPTSSPYSGRATGTPAIQIPPPSAEAITQTDPGFMTRRLSVPAYALVALVAGSLFAGFGVRGLFSGGGAHTPATITVTSTPATPAAPVVEPVATTPTTPSAETKPAVPPPVEAAKTAPTIADLPGSEPMPTDTPEGGLWKPAKKKAAALHKAPSVEPLADDTAAKPTPKPAVAPTPRPAGTAVASTPKPTVASTPKPAASKPAKKPTKVWIDPFAN